MKKAPPVRLSLRKLLTAMLAVGPVAILPSPVLAALPTYVQSSNSGSFTVTNGSVADSPANGVIQASDRSVLVWGGGNFNIGAAETYNFQVPGGAVLNKVGYSTAGTDTATIAGTLISSGKVFVLANGNIDVKGGAQITTQGGLYLSTLAESTDFTFTTGGNLAFSGSSQGSITLGNTSTSTQVNVSNGGLGAWAGTITRGTPLAVTGDLVLNARSSVSLTGGSGNNTTVYGNLTVTTNGSGQDINQGGGSVIANNTGAVTSLTTSGTGAIMLTGANNDFRSVTISSGTGDVQLTDVSGIDLNASTVGAGLTVISGGNINTTGAVVANNTSSSVNLRSSGDLTFANNSSVAGTLSATSTAGKVTLNTVGNLTTGVLGTGAGLATSATVSNGGAGYTTAPTVVISGGGGSGATGTATVSGGAVTAVSISGGSGYTSTPTISFSGGGSNPTTAATLDVVVLNGDAVTNLPNPLTGGTGYTTAPTVVFTGGGATTPAVYTATISGGSVTGFVQVNAGSGYTSAPTVTLTGGGANPTTVAVAGSPALATSTIDKSISVTSSGALNINGVVNGGNVVSFTGSSITGGGSGNVLTGNSVTYNATSGNLVVPATTAQKRIQLRATGDITQVGILSTLSSNTATANAGTTGNVTLNSNNVIQGVIQITAKDASYTNNGAITLGTTNVQGNLTVSTVPATTSGSITLGAGSGTATQNITVGNNLTLTTASATVADDLYSTQFVYGTTTINTVASGAGAAVTLNAAAGSSNGATGRYGQLNVAAGSGVVKISETTALNLGNITTTGTGSEFTSTGSDIVINGTVAVGAVTFNAANGAISQGSSGLLNLSSTSSFRSSNSFGTTLSNNSNSFGGTVTINQGGNNIINAGSSITVAANVTAGNLAVNTVNSGSHVTLDSTSNATNVTVNSSGQAILTGGTFQNLTITAADTSANSIKQTTGAFTLNGTLTLTSSGNVALSTYSNNITGSVVLSNVVNDAAIYSSRDLTVSGTVAGNLTIGAGQGTLVSYANPWNLKLGNLNVAKSLTAEAKNGNANNSDSGTSGTITQLSGTSIHVENDASFTTYKNNIVVANNGNSAGRVALSTGGSVGSSSSGNVTYAEDSTVKIGNVATDNSATLTSRFGSIIEDPAAAVNVTAKGRLTASAVNGSIMLGSTTHTSGATTGDIAAVNLTAAGAAQVVTTNNITIGATSANSLSVNSTVSNKQINQSAPISVYGLTTFIAGNNITLNDPANNFGPISVTLTSTNRNVAITEGSTLNLRSVTMPNGGNGTVTLTSVNGDIIDTGLGGVKLGGNSTGTGTGVVTLSAVNGNIAIDDPTSDFLTSSGVVFNAKNVNLSVLGSTGGSLVLGASASPSVVSGDLIASSALGHITNAGAFTVGGNAFFQAANGNININQPNVGFGTLKFAGKQVNIAEAGNMDILTGSSATEAAALSSGGNISVVNVGGTVTFGSTVNMVASGNITLSKVQAVNTLTVNAAGTKDLSALSVSADLGSKTPVNSGTGAYVEPKP